MKRTMKMQYSWGKSQVGGRHGRKRIPSCNAEPVSPPSGKSFGTNLAFQGSVWVQSTRNQRDALQEEPMSSPFGDGHSWLAGVRLAIGVAIVAMAQTSHPAEAKHPSDKDKSGAAASRDDRKGGNSHPNHGGGSQPARAEPRHAPPAPPPRQVISPPTKMSGHAPRLERSRQGRLPLWGSTPGCR